MDILKLIIIFTVIAIVMKRGKPIYTAVLVGSIASIFLFGIGVADTLNALRLGDIWKRYNIFGTSILHDIFFSENVGKKRCL